MCGLAGRFHPAGLPDAPLWHARADALLAHRGPDGGGHFLDGRCELVHRRLALLDLTPTGAQPMGNEDGEIQVVFNGEIYNHRELRRALEGQGHRFRSTTDTEVLAHLYEECGARMARYLRGIFAFAIYDRRRSTVLLGRDRFGVKPLFYTQAAPWGQWVFASEIKAIAALPGIALRPDRQACYDFLGLGYVPEPATGFADVWALPHGTTLAISAAGPRLARYHRVEAQPQPAGRLEPTVDACADAISAAVAAQSVADVPVAALLSGGIDSSLVVAAHRRAVGTGPRTFNVRFPDPDYDETPLAHAVAAHCGAEHHTIEARRRDLDPDAVFALLRHFDQPFADTSFLPTYWVASGVHAQGIICTLSGDGGDEAFGGYARFWQTNRIAALMRTPVWVRRAALRAGSTLAPHTRHWGRWLARATGLAEAGRHDSGAFLADLSSFVPEHQKEALVSPEARAGLLPAARLFDGYRPRATCDLEELSRRVTETLFALSLPSDMLRKVDMMSMRAGIEVRVPMLDERVVDVGLTLPHRLKTDGHRGKLPLRRLASAWLPPAVARHPKQGFGVPLDAILPPRFHDAVADTLRSDAALTRDWLDDALVGRWLNAFFDRSRGTVASGAVSREGLTQRVFTLLALELWMRQHHLSW